MKIMVSRDGSNGEIEQLNQFLVAERDLIHQYLVALVSLCADGNQYHPVGSFGNVEVLVLAAVRAIDKPVIQ